MHRKQQTLFGPTLLGHFDESQVKTAQQCLSSSSHDESSSKLVNRVMKYKIQN